MDGYITSDGQKTDAILVEIRVHGEPTESLSMAVPYRPADSADGFAVYRPKFLADLGSDDHLVLAEAFFRGVDSHEQGAKVWDEYIDESR